MKQTPETEAKMGRIVVPFEVKEVDPGSRTFEGLASTWDLDLGDDVIHRGAFKDTLAAWRKSPNALPLLNSHDQWNIFSALGQMVDARETTKGLLSQWEVIDGPDGDAALTRLRPSKRTGRAVIGSMSIGYIPIKFDFEDSDDSRYGQIRNLRKVDLKEVSLVIFPMNPEAVINAESVKLYLEHANADVRKAMRGTLAELVSACEGKACGCSHEPSPSKEVTGASPAWDVPGDTPLDLLKARRIASRTQALRGGLTTH